MMFLRCGGSFRNVDETLSLAVPNRGRVASAGAVARCHAYQCGMIARTMRLSGDPGVLRQCGLSDSAGGVVAVVEVTQQHVPLGFCLQLGPVEPSSDRFVRDMWVSCSQDVDLVLSESTPPTLRPSSPKPPPPPLLMTPAAATAARQFAALLLPST